MPELGHHRARCIVFIMSRKDGHPRLAEHTIRYRAAQLIKLFLRCTIQCNTMYVIWLYWGFLSTGNCKQFFHCFKVLEFTENCFKNNIALIEWKLFSSGCANQSHEWMAAAVLSLQHVYRVYATPCLQSSVSLPVFLSRSSLSLKKALPLPFAFKYFFPEKNLFFNRAISVRVNAPLWPNNNRGIPSVVKVRSTGFHDLAGKCRPHH